MWLGSLFNNYIYLNLNYNASLKIDCFKFTYNEQWYISVVIYDDGSSFLLKQHLFCIHTGWSKISDTGLNAHYSFKEQI